MNRRNRVPESVSMEATKANDIRAIEMTLQDASDEANARAESVAIQQKIKESGLPPAVYLDSLQGGAKPIFPVEELILTAPVVPAIGKLFGKTVSTVGKMFKTGSPKAASVNRVIPGKNATMPMTNVHSLSPESMQKVAENNGMLVNPSGNIQAKGGRGWVQHAGGDIKRSGVSSPESTFIVDLGKPSPGGFARGRDMFTSTVNSHLKPDGTLKPAAERYAAYAREKAATQVGTANAYNEVKRRLGEVQQKGISGFTTDSYVRPYSSGDVGFDLTGVQPNLSSPAVQSMRATATTSDLVSTIEATGVRPSADALITASMQPKPFGQRLQSYSSILRENKVKLNPKDTRSLYSALENTRTEAQRHVVSDLTEHNIMRAGTVEYKPAADVSLKGKTVIYTGDDARKMIPSLQKQLPDTKFIDGGNHPVQAAPIIEDEFETFMDAKGGDARNVRTDNKGGKAKPKWTWDAYAWNPKNGRRIDPKDIKGTGRSFDEKDRATIPKEMQKEFATWMDELANPKGEWTTGDGRKVTPRSALVPEDWRTNTEYNRDYDYVRAFLAARENPELAKVMVAPIDHGEEGYWLHMNDVGKLPTHPTFSRDSYYAQDPKYAPLAGSWEGEEYIPGEAERAVHEDAKGGDTGPAEDESIPEPGGASVSSPAGGGPRIVINPSTFRNEKDALCVAFNEAFRLVMEEMGFNPVAEPTKAQRRFFSDTAYADDELQLRRTILARICTFDTSVKDPTDEQLQEAVEFLTSVMEAGAPQNDWEQQAVMRLRDVISHVSAKGRSPDRPRQSRNFSQDESGNRTSGSPNTSSTARLTPGQNFGLS